MVTKQRLEGGQKWIELLLVAMIFTMLTLVIVTSLGLIGR